MDYLSCEDPQLLIGCLTQPIWLIATNYVLDYYIDYVNINIENASIDTDLTELGNL